MNIRALSDLFALRDERHDTHVFNIGVSVLEVYNDQVPSRRRAHACGCVAGLLVSSRFVFRWRSRRTFWSSAARRQRRRSAFVVAAALSVLSPGPDSRVALSTPVHVPNRLDIRQNEKGNPYIPDLTEEPVTNAADGESSAQRLPPPTVRSRLTPLLQCWRC